MLALEVRPLRLTLEERTVVPVTGAAELLLVARVPLCTVVLPPERLAVPLERAVLPEERDCELPVTAEEVPEERLLLPLERLTCWLLPEERVVLPLERLTCWLLPEERVVVPLERLVEVVERLLVELPFERVVVEPPPERDCPDTEGNSVAAEQPGPPLCPDLLWAAAGACGFWRRW